MADTDGGRRTFRVWRVQSVELLDAASLRPDDFDLHRAWEEIVTTLDDRRGLRHVTAIADQEMVRWLRVRFGTRLSIGAPNEDGRINVDIGFPETHDDPARELCSFADGVEVTGPEEVRARLADIGARLVSRYA